MLFRSPGFGGQKLIPYTIDKIRDLRSMLDERGLKTDIEADGGVTLDNVGKVLGSGANIVVAGSAVFGGNIKENIENFLHYMTEQEQK